MALCVPITKYREIKKLRDQAVEKIEEVTKEFDELKETTQEYKDKYEDLQKKIENPGSMSLAGGDEPDSGKILLEEDAYKEEAHKEDPWPSELKVKDLAKMSIEFMHSGEMRSAKDRRSTLKGTLSSKPLEVTIVNLSKKTTLQVGASFFKSGRFSSQPTGAVEAGESQTYTISSKDGRAKTGVKGGLAFIVYDVTHEDENNEGDEEKQDEMNGEKKNKKKSKKEKKEKKKKEKKSKKEKKKAKEENGEEKENKEVDEEENKEENNAENPDVHENGENLADETIPEENEDGETVAENKDEEDPKDESVQEEHKEEEEDLPDGNGDFFICAFENPLAGNPKAKCNKTESKDILPVMKQIKNDKPSQQELFGHYKFSRRHFVFVWKDDDTQW